MKRWCLCEHCIGALRSHGERVSARPMEFEDMIDTEYETDTVICDWCEEEFTPSEMSICN